MNMLDAWLFPPLERECNNVGAFTHDEIWKVVASVWRKVTSVECVKAHRRVLGNEEKVKELKGRKFLPRRR
jgi:hypothetical protein